MSPQPARRRMLRAAALLAGCGAAVACVAALAGGLWLTLEVRRAPVAELTRGIEVSRAVLDREGVLLRAFQAPDDRWRLPLAPEAVDPLYLDMLIAYEDRRFREHGGVDPRAIARALVQGVTQGRVVSGASTLTMQVARLLMEEPTRSLALKGRQMALALALEREFTKDEILALYLLRAPFGGNVEGVRAATLAWFGKEPTRLTPAEAALLVALPQSPEARRPDRDPDAARRARDRVLDTMLARGVLSADAVAAARRTPVPDSRRAVPRLAPHATRAALGLDARTEVRLTLDAGLQARLERLVADHARRLGRHVSVAVMVADHATGEILARVGSPGLLETERRGHVDMTRAVRSPGSTLKPLIYGLAFEEGVAHPDSLIDDTPTTLAGYSPTNFDLAFQGTVRVREALEASLNVPAVALLDAVGVSRLLARLTRAGIEPRLPEGARPGLALALGGFGLTLEDLVTLYAGLARGGDPVALRMEMAAPSAGGGAARASGPVLSAAAAWRIGDILSEVPPPATARGDGIAYKTGTSYGYRDAWAVGYDGRHVVGVWAGRADGSPVSGLTGYLSAAPILFEAFQRVSPERVRLPAPPPGVPDAGRDRVPEPLRHARTRQRQVGGEERTGPEIFYPPDGAVIDLGLSRAGAGQSLMVKARRGRGPYVWLANGKPVETGPFARSLALEPDGPGTSVITVIDADGRAARVRVHLR
ncbi:penicillin-binding protein 1C [Stappia sp.]|uniref:penicillin-binding protein 1C n=1 Tax=Stappia sp. TaxID=1870903 RepID=UPI0032D99946